MVGHKVMLDNFSIIAHNVVIGDATAMAAFCQVAGSPTIGSNCTFAANVGVVGHISIADNVVITARGLVTKSIVNAGFYSGSAGGVSESSMWRKNAAIFTMLDDVLRRVFP